MMTTLPNGVVIPNVGLGTFRLKGQACRDAVLAALHAGYRHVDTASIYNNETVVGEAIADFEATTVKALPAGAADKDTGAQVFVTTKLQPRDMADPKAVRKGFERSLRKLNLHHRGTANPRPVDLFLIHWPGCGGLPVDKEEEQRQRRSDAWRVLEDIYLEGRCRAIGVSNFLPRHLQPLLDTCRIVPMVNQFEVHPALPNKTLRAFCKQHDINPIAYSSLGCGSLLAHPTVADVAQRHLTSPANVLLQWALRQGLPVLPKSAQPERIKDNFQCQQVKLGDEDQALLDQLESPDGRQCWDPTKIA
eukprot:m.232982 g.232982  ORF g.232982 m.232982 type:complete len:305 (-) comp18892_c0_seq1:369-1283(-)